MMPAQTKTGSGKHRTAGTKKSLSKIAWLATVPVAALAVAAMFYFRLDYEPPAPPPPPPADALYKQAGQPVENRVKDLLDRMTLEEKIGQMAMVNKNSLTKQSDVHRYGLGSVLSGAGAKPDDNTAAGWQEMVESIKNEAKQSRLGIPLLFGADATHGHANVPGATVFPHAIGLGAANDPGLTQAVAGATAAELAATGINWNFAPMLDAPEDIRWGRTYEAFSSDAQINARLGAAYVAGTQLARPNGSFSLATAKHYTGVGSMKWNESNNKDFKIDQGKIDGNEALLNNQFLPPFKAAVDAGVGSVMIGLADYGGKRVIDNKNLVTDKLKNELGFGGIVVSDWYGVYEFSGVSRYQANVTTINAGLDMAMLPFDYKDFIKNVSKAVAKGDIPVARINDAVSRILTQKFKAGLFEEAQPAGLDTVGSAEHRALARQAVASSAVLLKNSENLLPLRKNAGRILIAGSGADNIGRQTGAWTVEWQGIDGNWLPGATSIYAGIAGTVGAAGSVTFDKDGLFPGSAGKADVGIAVVSEKPYAEGWGDNERPALDEADIQAIVRLKAAAQKLIIITVSGRPLFMADQIDQADAVVAAWLPGSEGAGVADVLFGDNPFTATLPVAWPARPEQLPVRGNTTADGSAPLYTRGYSAKP